MENSKSRKLVVASWLVGLIGCGACAIGAIAYMIMHFAGYQLRVVGPFKWEHLYVVAIAAGVFIVAAVILRIIAIAAKKNALANIEECEIIEEESNDEEVCDEICEECTEICEDEEAAEEAVPAPKGVIAIIKGKLTPENKEKIVAAAKKAAPVIAAVAATVVVTTVISKAAADRKQAKIRRSILKLLY